MAAGAASEDALDLFALVVEALEVAYCELMSLDEMGVPVPDKLRELAHEHAAMKGTLSRLPENLKARAKEVYREEYDRGEPHVPDLPVPVLEEVKGRVDDVHELVRRARLCSPALDAALRSRGT